MHKDLEILLVVGLDSTIELKFNLNGFVFLSSLFTVKANLVHFPFCLTKTSRGASNEIYLLITLFRQKQFVKNGHGSFPAFLLNARFLFPGSSAHPGDQTHPGTDRQSSRVRDEGSYQDSKTAGSSLDTELGQEAECSARLSLSSQCH